MKYRLFCRDFTFLRGLFHKELFICILNDIVSKGTTKLHLHYFIFQKSYLNHFPINSVKINTSFTSPNNLFLSSELITIINSEIIIQF